jgi:cytochrome b involved in lipid metabolism
LPCSCRGTAGKDATADYEDIGHSESAKEMMSQYCIGEFDAASIPAKVVYEALPVTGMAPSPRPSLWLTVLQLAVPLLLVAMAFGLQNFARTKTE